MAVKSKTGPFLSTARLRVARLPHLFGVLLAAASGVAHADPCTGPLPVPGVALAATANNGEKFRLISQQCTVLAPPLQVHRAAQLDLYGGTSSVTIRMSDLENEGSLPVAPLAPPPALRAPRPGRDGLRVAALAPAVTAAAQAHDLDPLLLHAIAHVESRHNPGAVSPAGARGLMQVMPATARRFGVGDAERALLDADTNLRASAAYLRTLRGRYGDDVSLVLAAYNAGEGAVAKHGNKIPPYTETQNYVRDVLAVYRRLSASFAVSASGALIARRELRGEMRADGRGQASALLRTLVSTRAGTQPNRPASGPSSGDPR